MRKRVHLILLSVLFMLGISNLSAQNNVKNDEFQGYKLIKKQFVKEVNAECIYLEHVKTGARVFKIKANDPNKTFVIAFKTLPETDAGTTHIIEHSVLNGSKKFPVKSPFEILQKGSLNTFLNAFTSKDATFYPFASMNEKDYYNLMDIYLDAVFNPLLLQNEKILKQEGWHYELMHKDSALEYRGIVYNEMKGVFSDARRELRYLTFKNLFPDNGYGCESGGYPEAVPTLTQAAFMSYYKRHYHPSNSYILFYGDADLNKELSFLDKEFLSKYEKLKELPKINDHKPFTAMKNINGYYSVAEGSNLKNKTYLTYTVVAGQSTDLALTMSLDLLCELLVNQETAPVRIALQKAGIGQDVYASTENYKQNTFKIVVLNANPEDKQKFFDIITNTLKEVSIKGFNKKEIEGLINRTEFQLREGDDSQKGFTAGQQILPGWFFKENPFLGIEYEKPLAEIKSAITTNYLENIISKYLINNPHSLLLSLEPKQGLEKEKNKKTAEELKNYKSKLGENDIVKLVKETNELIEYQKREDTPEQIATIPMLSLKDINPKSTWYGIEEMKIGTTPLLYHEEFTNNIVYLNLIFDLKSLPQEMLPYAALLKSIFTSMNTEKYSYGDLQQIINMNTGGIGFSFNSYIQNMDDNKLMPKFSISAKVMKNKMDKLMELHTEILLKTIFSDTARLKYILVRLQSQYEAFVNSDGSSIAEGRMGSYLNNRGYFGEITSGLDFCWFIKDLNKNFNQNAQSIVANLKKVVTFLFNKSNLITAITCTKSDLPDVKTSVEKFITNLPNGTSELFTWNFKPEHKNEGLQTESKVQYVYQGADYRKLGFKWSGKLRVLNQILSSDWLQTRVRVIGGAYGGWASISSLGDFNFVSYRDPNLKETFESYAGTYDYLTKFKADDKEMTRYIIGTIAGQDSPLTPSQRGNQALTWYFNGRTKEDLQRDRDEILTTKAEDIVNYAGMIKTILSQNIICVYGNSDKIQKAKELFKTVLKVNK